MDRQLPLEPTIRIDPSTLVEHMPGTDAICICLAAEITLPAHLVQACGWPFCGWKDHINDKEDE